MQLRAEGTKLPNLIQRFQNTKLYSFFADPDPRRLPSHQEASEWASEFRGEYLNSIDWKQTDKNDVAKFIFEHGLSDLEHADKAAESLRSKCLDLLRLNSALIVGTFALIRYFKDEPMCLAILAVFGLVFTIFLLWKPLAGLPYIAVPDAKRIADWERKNAETEASLKYNIATFFQRVLVGNLHVNSWVARHLSAAWLVTLISLFLLALELVF